MSITFNIKKESIVDTVDIPGNQISAYLLQKLLADKLKTKESQLTLHHSYTGLKLNPMEIIKDKSTIMVERLFKSETKINSTGIVSNQQLAEMGKKARFFMIKSSNQENIQKARQFSVWATTYANQDRLRSALLYSSHVFLLFATNRSYEIKGLARMEKQPSKTSQKSFWNGVNNIRLGGNFQIKWIRKQPLTSLQIQKALGSQFKDRVMRFSDGEQLDGQLVQKLILLFEVPTQPYYPLKQEQPQNKTMQTVKKVLGLGKILAPGRQIGLPFPIPIVSDIKPANSSQKQQFISTKIKQIKQEQQQKQQKKQKQKKKDKNRDSSDQSSQSSSSSQSRSRSKSSSRSQRSRKQKKIKKYKKNQKRQKKQKRKRRKSHSSEKRKSKKDKKKKHKKSTH